MLKRTPIATYNIIAPTPFTDGRHDAQLELTAAPPEMICGVHCEAGRYALSMLNDAGYDCSGIIHLDVIAIDATASIGLLSARLHFCVADTNLGSSWYSSAQRPRHHSSLLAAS